MPRSDRQIFQVEPSTAIMNSRLTPRVYELLKDSLGPEYWQGPDPEGPLPIR